jgi:hypothetical protein
MPSVHHIGAIVVRDIDFDDAVRWWAELLDAEIVARESMTSADPAAIGLPNTQLRGHPA